MILVGPALGNNRRRKRRFERAGPQLGSVAGVASPEKESQGLG